eukprot:GFUD01023370.1.p1 GENE.GFUD01023370.1~~GFUD01023370.1.p1  ORF type:complete len:269 (-),score=30.29 GFUD01023370.1:93-899(-)
MFGFGRSGPESGSCASNYQSCCYGGNTPSGGCFACCQRRGMSDDESGCCCCSFLLFIIGAVFIAFGVLFCYYPDTVRSIELAIYYNTAFIQLGFFQINNILIAAGFFMCMASICCFSTICTGFFHFITFIIILVCIIIMSITINDFNNEAITDKIEENMRSELKTFDNKTVEIIWSFIQQGLHCCGITNSSDWQENSHYASGTVPDSCCKNVTNLCGETARSVDLFQHGCLHLFGQQVFSHFWMVVMLLSGFCIINGLVVCSCCFQTC